MSREDITFQSDGLKLVGHFYKPDHIDPPYPTIVWAVVGVMSKS